MKRIRTIGMCLAAAFAFSAIAASSALASPEFVAKAGKSFPLHFRSLGGKALLATANNEIECSLTLNLGKILPIPNSTKSMLGDILFLFHGCLLKKAPIGLHEPCTTAGQPSGLIVTPLYLFHLGGLVTLGNGKKDVLILILVTKTVFVCAGITIEVEGNLVGVIPDINILNGQNQYNRFTTELEVEFKQTVAGKQQFTEFLLTLPTESNMLNQVLTTTIPALGSKEESSEEAKGTVTPEESVELKA